MATTVRGGRLWRAVPRHSGPSPSILLRFAAKSTAVSQGPEPRFVEGHSRHFGHWSTTSGPPSETDILGAGQHVSYVPKSGPECHENRLPIFPQQRTSRVRAATSEKCRFCCRSRLKASANNDSLT